MATERVFGRKFLTEALHLFVLCSFAVAQPIYDLVGSNAEFFVAHRAGPGTIVAFVLALSVGLPALLVLIEALALLASARLQQILHLLFVFVLAAALAAPALNRIPGLSAPVALAAAGVAGLLFAGAYARVGALRSFVTVLSPGILAFPVILLAFTPVAKLVAPPAASASAGVRLEKATPVVFVIFDEFEAGALLDEKKEIDAVRYPNFAALARTSWWFPRATTVWTETQRAVPAILTGLRPHDPAALPSVQSHPNNLFTWLHKGGYDLKAVEPLTNLCPQEQCPPAAEDAERLAFDPEVFASDLAVIYLHILLPRQMSDEWLPRMDGTWRGFAAAGPAPEGAAAEAPARAAKGAASEQGEFRARFNTIVTGDRRTLVASFLDGIKPEARNTLHFLHILLPHDPYLYLPSGSMYPGGNTEGLVDRIWVEDDQLPKLGYQRYLLQVGYVDTMIGELIARLKAAGLYDSALIVITADHGKSFRPGQPKRTLAEAVRSNAADLLQVPLFMKLPGQTVGERSERPVISVDIMPTVAAALGTTLPWKTDGVSMIGPDFPERPVVEIRPVGEGGRTDTFDTAELTSYPHLPWKLGAFGAGTPLDTLAMADPHADLVGKAVADLPVDEEPAGLRVESKHFGTFEDVEPKSGVVPVLIQGEIVAEPAPKDPVRLAIALNGVIQVTTRTTASREMPHYFAALVPEKILRQGRNVVEVFRIESRDGARHLARIPTPEQSYFRLSRDASGQESLTSSTGGIVPVRPGAVSGHLDKVISTHPRWYGVQGWAVAAEPLKPAPRILFFVDGKQVFSGGLGRNRPDLVKHFGSPDVLPSGFRFEIPKAVLRGREASLRVFAISEGGVASELSISAPVRATFAAVR